MNRPTRAFALAIVGGAASMVGLPYYNPYVYRGYFLTDPVSLGMVIAILAILLHEMPGRNVSFGAAITAFSSAELASSIILMTSAFSSLPGFALPLGYAALFTYVPLASSIVSLLGGIAAMRWKPRTEPPKS